MDLSRSKTITEANRPKHKLCNDYLAFENGLALVKRRSVIMRTTL